MSIYLSVVPISHTLSNTRTIWAWSTRLNFDSDYRVLGQLTDLSMYRNDSDAEIPAKPSILSYPLPPGIMVEMVIDDKVVATRRDKRDLPIVYTTADEMKRLKLPQNSSPVNRASKAYIDMLPDDWAIILLWR